jgi:uridine phosphorylase
MILNDYDEKGVITPESWFKIIIPEEKLEQIKGINKFILTFSSIGAPAVTMVLEELIYLGGKYFILTGGVGILNKDIQRGDIIIPGGAIRDEGTSYHYLPPKVEVKPSACLTDKLKNICTDTGIKFHEGKVWTTDAAYRETPARIKKFRKEGAICVDMEASACFAVSTVRNVYLSAIFYAGDYLDESGWDYRKNDVEMSKDAQNILFHIICKTFKELKI